MITAKLMVNKEGAYAKHMSLHIVSKSIIQKLLQKEFQQKLPCAISREPCSCQLL